MLCPSARHFIHCLVLVQPRKTDNHADMTENLLTRTTHKELKQTKLYMYMRYSYLLHIYVSREDSAELALLCSLSRAFATGTHK